MVISLEEWQAAQALLEEAKRELSEEGIPYAKHIETGVMIEVPAAVLIADYLAEEVDFFSIGTNDLIQYTLAVDRMNDHIAHLYDPLHPAVMRLIKMTVEAAARWDKPVSVCGEMAGDPHAVPLLLGLGVRQLSMSVRSILEIKGQLLGLSIAECTALVEELVRARTGKEAAAINERWLQLRRR